MALDTKRSRAPHIHVTRTAESQISLSFVLWLTVFEVQAILRHMQRLTLSKTHWILKGQRYPIYISQLPTSPKFHPVLLYGHLFFELKAILRQCTE